MSLVPVLNEDMRELLAEHTSLQNCIDRELKKVAIDHNAVACLKRKKLVAKDQLQVLLGQLPTSQVTPASVTLYPLTDAELSKELTRRNRELRRVSQRLGSTASALIKLRARVSEAQNELYRRELEMMFAPEKQFVAG